MRQPVSRGLSIGMTVVTLVAIGQSGLATAQTVEWPAYAADQAGTKYLLADLEIVWRQPVIPDAIRNGETTRGPVGSQTTPLMVGGLLYFSTGLGTIAALEPTTGEVVWNTGPVERWAQSPTATFLDIVLSDGERVRQTRGIAYWTDGDTRRIVATLGPKLQPERRGAGAVGAPALRCAAGAGEIHGTRWPAGPPVAEAAVRAIDGHRPQRR